MNKPKWTFESVNALYEQPLNDLLFEAHTIHRQHFNHNQVQLSTLLSIKTGACPEDCSYCSQSGHHNTDLEKERLLPVDTIIEKAKAAKANGATRFCMAAAWRSPPKKQLPAVIDAIKQIKALGLETCVSLGMLDEQDVEALDKAGLDYYNHNLDTSPEYYKQVATTRTYEDRLATLARVEQSNINVCCGGIIGMGESRADRIQLLIQLANRDTPPQSVPINKLTRIKGTPFSDLNDIDSIEFVKTIAVSRQLMPTSFIRLSSGRKSMSDEMQALCFFAGANSIHCGDKLLTTENPTVNDDTRLFKKLGIEALVS